MIFPELEGYVMSADVLLYCTNSNPNRLVRIACDSNFMHISNTFSNKALEAAIYHRASHAEICRLTQVLWANIQLRNVTSLISVIRCQLQGPAKVTNQKLCYIWHDYRSFDRNTDPNASESNNKKTLNPLKNSNVGLATQCFMACRALIQSAPLWYFLATTLNH